MKCAKNWILFAAISCFFVTGRVAAGAIAPPYEYFLTHDPKGDPFVFVMETNSGYCLRLGKDGKLSRSWSVDGWYSYPPDLSIDKSGSLLSRMHRVHEKSVSNKELANILDEPLMTFFQNGKILKIIKVGDIFTKDQVDKAGVNSNDMTYKFISEFKFFDFSDISFSVRVMPSDNLPPDQQLLKIRTFDNREFCLYLDGSSIKKVMISK